MIEKFENLVPTNSEIEYFDCWEKAALKIVNHLLAIPQSEPFVFCASKETGVKWDRIDDYPGIV